ncbi:L-aminoadipate-semialdehyde dehydrogenase large subunit [Metarhizium rileyi]|uniref:Alpha-aminoadipate reductase n=1 Tax=Metarhizium rileyi (strain RCEF 4871) TaxID=1649241 RepID=A0A162LVE6_METRR|nr:L-aminoadipate-semialdehyde dehydrogenase large subunit [Metarhizium rileyi RCEF 4871]TWU78270.1 large subunit of alpha-aminoadipate reductase [Metarhizium rileyi]
MSDIPDPTADLDWSCYPGAIHNVFHNNAVAHPDRICVRETPTSTSPLRTYTYRQIDEASNLIAHQLHDAGITNGDAVMIFAHRSVELVCAFMGTLAAGAIVTVLDPLYPPQRQQIYLEVSQPKALISIGKATDEHGPLAPLVQEYIKNELNIKTQIPNLRLSDTGMLSAGEDQGSDIFASTRAKASSPPSVLVGPDSNPTLAFTSGSEGRPKGVLGRHYSLTRYFPWMAERFQLSSESVFACLSGIAHDPIQRDIMTPLWLGAQLLIPAKEDIQHEKLSEWMQAWSPSIVHLTPAMGQILCGGAVATFPALRHAFFVGDILTTRDCKALRKLGPSCNIINMYGTTETSRAVSYFEIPSATRDPAALDTLGDTIPAGWGMQNVQVLVISLTDHTSLCATGEVGEIYIRAAGLAEGYLGDPEKNKEKFVNNWFVDTTKWVEADKAKSKGEPWRRHYKGPRDRLYRTGDLGQYLPSGAVRVSGRIDSQVKIRGFRIELNEIDANLSGSPLIRDCKTLVRRDRNEELTLVSYVVPEIAEWERWLQAEGHQDVQDQGITMGSSVVYLKRFRRIQAEAREHLKTRLAAHSVPSVYIVLQKLPLNPNGKVDSPNLPFPDAATMIEDASEEDLKSWEKLSETEKTIASQWSVLIPSLNAKTVKRESSFFDCGGHSLLAQQLVLEIRKSLGVDITIGVLYANPNLGALSTQVDRVRSGQAAVTNEAADTSYAESLDELLTALDAKYQGADPNALNPSSGATFFITGATGFLGAYLVKDILDRDNTKLIVHIRGAKDAASAQNRLVRSLKGYGLWRDSWTSRVSCILGDISKPRLGIDDASWKHVAETADVVIHNAAYVHWIAPYKLMMRSNVLSTMDAMKLCNEGKPKLFAFVSSTSTLDTDHYIKLSHEQTATGRGAVLEADDMQGSRVGLGTGYGQTKWVSEQLVREAGKRGLRGAVVRPGYILGSRYSGVSNTDDFLIRLCKGCIQLGARPRIINSINACPVDHVAHVVVAAALNPLPGVQVVHVTAHPRLRMNEFLSALSFYGYVVPEVDYDEWKTRLETFVSAGSVEKDQEQSALMPLFHMATADLPSTTRAPELDDRNAMAVLQADADRWTGVDDSAGEGIGREDIGRYLRFLVDVGFLTPPTGRGRELPVIAAGAAQAQAQWGVGGRGGV